MPDLGESRNTLLGIVSNLQRIQAIRRAIVDIDAEVTLSLMPTANVLCAIAAIGTKLVTVGSEHSYPPKERLRPWWHWLRKRTYFRHRRVTVLTIEAADWFEQNITGCTVQVVPNPVQFPISGGEPIVLPHSIGLPGCCKYTLLAVGRLVASKGFDRLIEVFSRLVKDFPDWDLIILGEGELRRRLQEQCVALEVAARVHLPGAVGNVGDWYQYADVYVMTSRYEGFGNTLAEALTYGLPAVAKDCDTGPRNIIRNGWNGLLVPDGDLSGLENELRLLMSDGSRRAALSVNAAEARTRYAVANIAGKWEKVVHSETDGLRVHKALERS